MTCWIHTYMRWMCDLCRDAFARQIIAFGHAYMLRSEYGHIMLDNAAAMRALIPL